MVPAPLWDTVDRLDAMVTRVWLDHVHDGHDGAHHRDEDAEEKHEGGDNIPPAEVRLPPQLDDQDGGDDEGQGWGHKHTLPTKQDLN